MPLLYALSSILWNISFYGMKTTVNGVYRFFRGEALARGACQNWEIYWNNIEDERQFFN